jgi:hypothetical protein
LRSQELELTFWGKNRESKAHQHIRFASFEMTSRQYQPVRKKFICSLRISPLSVQHTQILYLISISYLILLTQQQLPLEEDPPPSYQGGLQPLDSFPNPATSEPHTPSSPAERSDSSLKSNDLVQPSSERASEHEFNLEEEEEQAEKKTWWGETWQGMVFVVWTILFWGGIV